MVKTFCIECSKIYKEEDDGRKEYCHTHGICNECLQKVREDNKKKKMEVTK